MLSSYEPPLALTVIASLFIGLAGLVSIWIMWDILRRRGWRSMMGVMCVFVPSRSLIYIERLAILAQLMLQIGSLCTF